MTPDVGHRVGFVSTEGGPLLIADRAVIGRWSGADGPDYDRACNLLDEAPEPDAQAHGRLVEIMIGGSSGLLWDVPPGTVEVCRREDGILLCEPAESGEECADARDERVAGAELRLEITSGFVVMLWAPESGAEATAEGPEDGRALDLSVGEAGIEVRVEPGTYAVTARRRTPTAGSACSLRGIGEAGPVLSS